MRNSHSFSALLCLWYCMVLLVTGVDAQASLTQGLGVWNDALSIHQHDTLVLQGDLFLSSATIEGTGVLRLQDSVSRTIVAIQSSVQNLHLLNRDTISLHGHLQIQNSLRVQNAVFDVRQGQLSLADTAQLLILGAGELLDFSTANTSEECTFCWFPLLPQSNLPPVGNQLPTIQPLADPLCIVHVSSYKLPRFHAAFYPTQGFASQAAMSTLDPPPELISLSTR